MSAIANRVMRAFSLVITDRRWTAPLSAAALGFGLFVGVAIGPNAAGTLAGATQILEIPSGGGGGGEEPEAEADGGLALAGSGGAGSGGEGASLEAPLAPAPLAPAPVASPPAEEEAAPEPAPPASEEPSEEDEEETELAGVVVHANPAAGSYALAIEGGELVPVHARKLPPPGAKLTVAARRLANGTFAESEPPKRSGLASQASFRGVVTFVDPTPAAPAYTVSGRGASLLVHVEPDPSGAVPQLPATGSYVTVTAALEAGLWQRQLEIEEGEPATYLDLTGVVQTVLPETAQLVLSADGMDESGADLTLTVPSAMKLTMIEPGDSYLATATVEPDGTLVLEGIASDEHTKHADDPALAQGDLKR